MVEQRAILSLMLNYVDRLEPPLLPTSYHISPGVITNSPSPPPVWGGGGFLVLEEMIYGSAFKIADKVRVGSNTTLTSRTLLFQTSVKKLKNLKNDILIIQNTSTVQ